MGRGGHKQKADDVVTQQSNLPARFLTGEGAADDEIEVHVDDAATVALFLALDTQWRRHPFTGHRAGLDYAAIKPTADLAGLEITPAVLPGLRVMEQAAIAAIAETMK